MAPMVPWKTDAGYFLRICSFGSVGRKSVHVVTTSAMLKVWYQYKRDRYSHEDYEVTHYFHLNITWRQQNSWTMILSNYVGSKEIWSALNKWKRSPKTIATFIKQRRLFYYLYNISADQTFTKNKISQYSSGTGNDVDKQWFRTER